MTSASYQVSFTDNAEEDLEQLYSHVATYRSPAEATDLLDVLLGRVAALDSFPLRGVIPRELESLGIAEFRQIVAPPYRLIYKVVGETVFVVLIADCRRDMKALLQMRLLQQ